MFASTKDLRFNTRELMNIARSGEDVIITYHGKPSVKLTLIDNEAANSNKKDLDVFGMWSDDNRFDDPVSYVQGIRKGRFE